MTRIGTCFRRAIGSVAVVGMVVGPLGASVRAQSGMTVRVVGTGVVTENPRGDSLVLGTVESGVVLEVIEDRNPWFLVRAPDPDRDWRSGWINERYLVIESMPPASVDGDRQRLSGGVRGFAQFGGIRFRANDSFEAVTGSAWGTIYGGGAQVNFSGGLFVQGSYERYEETGQRAFVFEDELFPLDIEDTLTITPIQVTVGYREPAGGDFIGYVGGGIGWHRFEEHSAFSGDEAVDESKVSYHLLGGVEYPVLPWVWVGGEMQWTHAPDLIGESGLSAPFEEDDLGGFTFRVKLSVGN